MNLIETKDRESQEGMLRFLLRLYYRSAPISWQRDAAIRNLLKQLDLIAAEKKEKTTMEKLSRMAAKAYRKKDDRR